MPTPFKRQRARCCSDSQNPLPPDGKGLGDGKWASSPVPLLPDEIDLGRNELPVRLDICPVSAKGNSRCIALRGFLRFFADSLERLGYALVADLAPSFHPLFELLESTRSLSEQ